MDYEGKLKCTQNINKYHFDQQILTMHVINEFEKMDPKFYEKLTKIDIPPPTKIMENGSFFINHGLYDGTLKVGVPYFDDVVENDRKSRISRTISPYKMKYYFDQEIVSMHVSNE
ncbi:hypothetical protein PFMG_02490 [Plasmodium falciparum IGH-CR14]|uniref:Uncharacterized protein n=1 Tax=Plasmodium falciparum IGH-CR14 TaxID=580059 RepID=A0A0L1IAQ0_PLAFA|nr:hypothetical protein PFMG_02490 [Plasmodium falciparum IGH-CR14]